MMNNTLFKLNGVIVSSVNPGVPRFTVSTLSAIDTAKKCKLNDNVNKNRKKNLRREAGYSTVDLLLNFFGIISY